MNQGNPEEIQGFAAPRGVSPLGAVFLSAAFVVVAATLAAFPAGVRGEEKKVSPDAAKEAKVARQKAVAEKLKKRLERQKTKEQEAAKDQEKAALPPRPARTVTTPSLTSAELDSLVKKHLATNDPKVVPAPVTSDVEFVRRIYFDLTGQPPTAAQVQTFVRDTSKEKRTRLIDHLLEAPEFATNWSRYWRDVVKFHATGQNAARIAYPALEEWLAEKFKKNAPWDEIVTEMITATGRNDENGAIGLSLAHGAQPIELAGEVSRIFMGIQIQCAQCHDHKTDSWKQQQFHEFAAFFAGGQQRRVSKPIPGKPAVFGVFAVGKPRYTYTKVDDPKKQIPVSPKFFLTLAENAKDDLPQNLDAVSRRKMVASYITGQDNPWFAKAFVNRTWYALMGEAFYTPIDDIGPERDVKAAQVLEPLATQWQKGGYDVRWLYRTILNTESYQRRVRSTSNAAGKTAFASNCPSRLRSDQIGEALVQALGLPAATGPNADLLAARLARKDEESEKTAATATPASLKSGDDKPGMKKPDAETPVVKTASVKKPAALARMAARRGGINPLLLDNIFGVDPSAANEDVLGTIPQALFMMNSPIVNNRVQAKPGTVLDEILKNSPNDRAALGKLYVLVLSRQPTPKEVETCSHHMSSVGNRAEAFEDIYWCLINTTEFITRR